MFWINNDLLFGAFTNAFVLGWCGLAAAAFLSPASRPRRVLLTVAGRILPLFVLGAFVVGWVLSRGLPGDIFTFAGVLEGFSVPEKVLIAWIEILGLALLVCRWMIDDAAAMDVPSLILLTGLLGAFFAAAIGLVCYLAMSRAWIQRRSPTLS